MEAVTGIKAYSQVLLVKKLGTDEKVYVLIIVH
jgi:hypothetical protein